MNIIDTAIKMEIEGERFYRELAAAAGSEGFKTIFIMLADDEVKHREKFEEIKASGTVKGDDYTVVSSSSDFFKNIKKEDFANAQNQLALYRKSMDLEKESVAYYEKQLELDDDRGSKALLTRVLEEEKMHLELLSRLVEYVEAPDRWVENAEFGSREEY